MAFERLMKLGVQIFGHLDPSLNRAFAAAQDSVSKFGDKMRREINGAIAGPQQTLSDFFGSNLYGHMQRTALATTLGLGASVLAARNYQKEVFEVGLITNATNTEMAALHDRLSEISSWKRTNQSVSQLARGMRDLVTEGYTLKEAMDAIESVGRVATATGTDIADVAKTTFQLTRALQIPASELERTFDGLLFTAKQGAFEMRDMAQYFPELLAAAGTRLGSRGRESAINLGAMAQIVRTSFSDSGEAATALTNAVNEMMKATFLDRAKKEYGVDFRAVLEIAQFEGRDPVMAGLEKLREMTSGNAFEINKLVVRKEAQQALSVLLTKWDQLLLLQEEAKKSKGLISTDFMKQIDSYPGVMQAWRVQTERFLVEVGTALFPVLKSLLIIVTPLMEGFINFTRKFPWATTAVVALAGALATLVLVAPGIWSTIAVLKMLGGIIAGIKVGALIAGWLPVIKGAVLALGGLAGAFAWPILAIVAVGAALVLLYKKNEWFRNAVNSLWDRIAAYWMKKWENIKRFWGGVWDAIAGVVTWFYGLFTGDVDLMEAGWERMTNGLKNIFKAIVDQLKLDWDTWCQGFKDGIKGVKEAFTADLRRMIEGWEEFWNKLKGGDVKGAVTGKLGQDWWNIGRWLLPASFGGMLGENVKTAQTFGKWYGRQFAGGAPAPTPPARALGGNVFPGVRYLVGERRPEILEIPTGPGTARILPSVTEPLPARELPRATPQALAAAPAPSRSVVLNMPEGAVQVTVGGHGGGSDPDAVRRAVQAALDQFRIDLESSYRSLLND